MKRKLTKEEKSQERLEKHLGAFNAAWGDYKECEGEVYSVEDRQIRGAKKAAKKAKGEAKKTWQAVEDDLKKVADKTPCNDHIQALQEAEKALIRKKNNKGSHISRLGGEGASTSVAPEDNIGDNPRKREGSRIGSAIRGFTLRKKERKKLPSHEPTAIPVHDSVADLVSLCLQEEEGFSPQKRDRRKLKSRFNAPEAGSYLRQSGIFVTQEQLKKEAAYFLVHETGINKEDAEYFLGELRKQNPTLLFTLTYKALINTGKKDITEEERVLGKNLSGTRDIIKNGAQAFSSQKNDAFKAGVTSFFKEHKERLDASEIGILTYVVSVRDKSPHAGGVDEEVLAAAQARWEALVEKPKGGPLPKKEKEKEKEKEEKATHRRKHSKWGRARKRSEGHGLEEQTPPGSGETEVIFTEGNEAVYVEGTYNKDSLKRNKSKKDNIHRDEEGKGKGKEKEKEGQKKRKKSKDKEKETEPSRHSSGQVFIAGQQTFNNAPTTTIILNFGSPPAPVATPRGEEEKPISRQGSGEGMPVAPSNQGERQAPLPQQVSGEGLSRQGSWEQASNQWVQTIERGGRTFVTRPLVREENHFQNLLQRWKEEEASQTVVRGG